MIRNTVGPGIYDLTKIARDDMGGAEFEAYVGNVIGSINGANPEKVEVNAVYGYAHEECWRAGRGN